MSAAGRQGQQPADKQQISNSNTSQGSAPPGRSSLAAQHECSHCSHAAEGLAHWSTLPHPGGFASQETTLKHTRTFSVQNKIFILGTFLI